MMDIVKRYKDYTYKIIRSGDITEIYAYQESLLKRQKKDIEVKVVEEEIIEEEKGIEKKVIKGLLQSKSSEMEYYRRKSDISLTKRKMKRLIYANLGQYDEVDKFVTLTFSGECPTRDKVVKEFREFKRRFQYKFGDKFEYIAIIERGEKGTKRLHIHMVIFGMKYLAHNDLVKLWKNGRCEIKKVYMMNDVADYMTKYIGKTLEDGYIDKGKRFYFPSTNLKKPQEEFLSDDEMYDFVNQVDVGSPIYNFSFDSTYVGLCNYTKFKKS